MNKITLAIPFYNTSRYFLDCIKYSINDNFVDEIVVNDDCSNEKEYDRLLKTIESIDNDKIKVYRNESNLGPFRNKYKTVSNCSNDWVYLLDSDNYPFEDSYTIIKSVEFYDDVCYSPEKLFCKHDNTIGYENIADYKFPFSIIGIEESKISIINNLEWFDWFINTGNYIFNKNTYLKNLKEPYENLDTPLLHADTAASFYFWLKNGGKFKVVDDLKHNHRLRPDSTWHRCGSNSQTSVNYYKKLITEL